MLKSWLALLPKKRLAPLLVMVAMQAHGATQVRVRIATLNTPVFEVSGISLSFQGEKKPFQRVAIPRVQQIQVELKDFSKKIWQYKVSEDQVKTIYSDYLTLQGDFLRLKTEEVPSHIFLWPRSKTKIDVIAVLDLEDYLKGVLPFEMPIAWNKEALKAQAIIARSFTLRMLEERKQNPYQLDSTVNDQVYRYRSALSQKDQEKLEEILKETKNQILLWQGRPAKTLYHADCGGQTEKSSEVWGAKEVEFSVVDQFCPKGPNRNWEYLLDSQEIQSNLQLPFLPEKIQIPQRSPSGRAEKVILSNLDQKKEFSSQEFRRRLGYGKIKSTLFEIQKKGKNFIIHGRGFGHGVGLCQWGAKAWAEHGLNYKMILKHYFPQYTLQDEAF